jgi:hypothetical protein
MSELSDGFAAARAALDSLESDIAAGKESQEAGEAILANVVAALTARTRNLVGRFEPTLKAGRKVRGLGYDIHEAHVMASLPDHGDSIEKAARAYWEAVMTWIDDNENEALNEDDVSIRNAAQARREEEDTDWVDNWIHELYRHKRKIDSADVPDNV